MMADAFPLTRKHLIEALNKSPTHSANPSFETLLVYMSHYVLKQFLGYEWGVRVIAEPPPPNLTNNEKLTREFFISDSVERSQKDYSRRSERTVRLAQAIYNVQKVEGALRRIGAIHNDPITRIYAELIAVEHMTRHRLDCKFKTEEGEKGKDYDFYILLPNGERIYCEAKNKESTTVPSENTIANRLKDARRQLPEGKPGIVCLRIPETWTENESVIPSVKVWIKHEFRNTGRIVAVLMTWNRWKITNRGWNCQGLSQLIRNERKGQILSSNPSIKTVLDQIDVRHTTATERNLAYYDSDYFLDFPEFVSRYLNSPT